MGFRPLGRPFRPLGRPFRPLGKPLRPLANQGYRKRMRIKPYRGEKKLKRFRRFIDDKEDTEKIDV